MQKTDDRENDVLNWYKKWRETNNNVFSDLIFCEKRYLVLMGGGGSGKSIFAGRKILERCATEPGHRALVIRKVYNTIYNSCFEQLVDQVNEFYKAQVKKIKLSPLTILFKNGSKIIFKGLDDKEKLKSIKGITMIWIEEASEILESDFDQLDIRLRDESPYYQQIILSFNPITITHWLKKRFFDKQDDRARTSRTNYKDNKFLTAEAIKTLENFRETDEYYYMVYCLGEWGVTGKTVFPAKLVAERLKTIPKPIRQGYFTYREGVRGLLDIKWQDDDRNPLILIYEDVQERHPYVIGCDTAGDGSDRFIGQVLDNATGNQVAKLKLDTGEKEFVNQVFCLGEYYNKSLIGVESNFSTYPNNELARMRYPKLYVRQSLDSYTHKPKEMYGFRTEKLSRNSIIAKMIEFVKRNIDQINDEDTLNEMLTFVRNEDFRPEAQEGAHDDCIMSFAIALEIRGQKTTEIMPERAEQKAWTEDMWDDYISADEEEKNYLKTIWGEPKAR